MQHFIKSLFYQHLNRVHDISEKKPNIHQLTFVCSAHILLVKQFVMESLGVRNLKSKVKQVIIEVLLIS